MMMTNTILDKLPRFKYSETKNPFTPNDQFGELIGVYDNYPFGDDLYVYEQAIYWNVNGLNYCFFIYELETATMDSQADQHIQITLSSAETLKVPVRGQNDIFNEACEFLHFLQALIDNNTLE